MTSRLAGGIRRFPAVAALLLGLLQVLAFPPFSWWWLGLLALAAFFLLLEDGTPGRAARVGFGFGAGLVGGGTYWLYTAIHDFGRAPVWLALFLMAGLVALMAAWYALLGYVSRRCLVRAGPVRWLLVLPAGWVLVEWARSRAFTGFPWLTFGYPQVDTWLGGYAPVGGVYLASLAAAICAGALAAMLATRGREWRLPLAALTLVTAGGWGLSRIDWVQPAGPPLAVAIVQGAVPQDLKWSPEQREATLALYRDLSRGAWGAPLVVWPEAALPVLAEEATPFLREQWAEASRRGSALLLGLLSYDLAAGTIRNGLLVLDVAGKPQWYFKRHLVPFGEYFPVPAKVREWMRLSSLAYVDLTPGSETQPVPVAQGLPLAATICYEDAYGSDQLAPLASARLLVNVTNNAWYGDSTAAHQHLQIARLRALEAGRYLVRATSNGISVVTDARGRVLAQAPQFEAAVLRGEVVPMSGLTPYARSGGDWPVLVLAGLALIAGLRRRRGDEPARQPDEGLR